MNFKFSPSKEFAKKAKDRFLAAFDIRFPAPRVSWPVFAGKTFATVVAVAAIFLGGASVYADTANVPADNLLYPLKRLHENIQLAVAPAIVKPQLQAAFAERRITEANDLEVRKPANPAISKLEDEADDNVNASIQTADQVDLQDGALTSLCGKLFATITTSSANMQDEIAKHGDLLDQFTSRCEVASGIAQEDQGGPQATSTPSESVKGAKGNKHRNHPGPGVATPFMASGTVSAPGTVSSSDFQGEAVSGTVPASFTASTSLEMRIQNFLLRTQQDNVQSQQDQQGDRTDRRDENRKNTAIIGGINVSTSASSSLQTNDGNQTNGGNENDNNLVPLPSF